MKTVCFFICAAFLLADAPTHAQSMVWKNKNWECRIAADGTLEHIVFKDGGRNDTVPFFRKGNAGPSFYANMGGKNINAQWIPNGYRSFRAAIDGVECNLTYKEWKGKPAIRVTLANKGNVPFQPVKAGLKLGIDTWMEKYPDWFGKYFPTLMMNEKSHFYGYLQTPAGHTLAIVSPQPVASWSVDYNLGYLDPAPHWFMGHRIESLNLDLLNALPLPAHCPLDLWQLKQGETKEWIIAFAGIRSPNEFEETVHHIAGTPVIRMNRTAYRPGDKAVFEVLSDGTPDVQVADHNGSPVKVTVEKTAANVHSVSCTLSAAGLYTIKARQGAKQATGTLSAHNTWKWTLEKAREGALKYHQKATSHAESWYGFHSAFIAARHFPEKQLDEALRTRFDRLFNLLHDSEKMKPLFYASRIQNTSCTIGLLVDKYEAYGDLEALNKAARLADWLIATAQRADGAYVNHGTVYTSVIYVAKSILELVSAEYEQAKKDSAWQEIAERHYASAKRAIDQLVDAQGDFQTEGELTFEDGMISCSALQIGMLALMQPEGQERKRYTEAMLKILRSHDCLAQLRVPDARRRGGTMRFWEAQYDVQMLPNMFNSPHGWSGWRAYATYYAYLLTGDERWIEETYNAMGTFSNLIDFRTGDLRWAFVVDPYLRVRQTCSHDTRFTADSLSFGNPHPNLYDTREFVIGEQYVNMISDWQTVNTQDNDVHELFKCMGETVLTNAFIVERTDGSIMAYNCHATQRKGQLTVTADEKQIIRLHCNLKSPFTVSFNGKTQTLGSNYLGWAFTENK